MKNTKNQIDWQQDSQSEFNLRFRLNTILVGMSIFIGVIMLLFMIFFFNRRLNEEFYRNATVTSRLISSILDGDTVDYYLDTLDKISF